MVKVNDVIAGAVSRPALVTAGSHTPMRQRTGGAASSPAARSLTGPTVAPPIGWAPAEPTVRHAAVRSPAMPTGGAPSAVPGPADVTAVNTPAFTRPWAPRPEELDANQQRARQTASRRYE
jgi:hypothetical protein